MKKLFLFLMLAAVAFSSSYAGATNLPFLQDDFAKAQALARQRKLPVFVECWAPW